MPELSTCSGRTGMPSRVKRADARSGERDASFVTTIRDHQKRLIAREEMRHRFGRPRQRTGRIHQHAVRVEQDGVVPVGEGGKGDAFGRLPVIHVDHRVVQTGGRQGKGALNWFKSAIGLLHLPAYACLSA